MYIIRREKKLWIHQIIISKFMAKRYQDCIIELQWLSLFLNTEPFNEFVLTLHQGFKQTSESYI